MTRNKIKDQLIKEGWEEGKSNTFCTDIYFKVFPSKHKCLRNEHRDGVQIELRATSQYKHEGDVHMSLHIRGETKDTSWFHFQNFSHIGGLDSYLKSIPRLIEIWDFAVEL